MDNMANMLDIQKLEKSVVEIKGEIETTAFEAFRDQAVKHLAEHVEIDGFRKGHVPANVALKNLSESQILEEMAQKALSVEFPKIIKENKIDAIGYPSIQITKLASGNPLGFTIKVAVLPEVVLPDYKKIAAKENNEFATKDIKEEEKAKALEDNRVAIVETIIKETKLDVPEVLVHSEAHSMMSRLKRDLEAMNMKFEDYLKMVGKDEKALAEQLHLDAEKRAKMQLIVAEIAKAEKITAPKETVDAEVKKVVDVYKDADQNNARMYIESVLINEEVFKFLEAQK